MRRLICCLTATLAAACATTSTPPPLPSATLADRVVIRPAAAPGERPTLQADEHAENDEIGKRSAGHHEHHLAFAVGIITASEGDGLRLGGEYERDWDEDWGLLNERFSVGALVDYNIGEGEEAVFLAPQITYHPEPPVRFVLAPGFEFGDDESEFLLRIGMAYEFEIGHDLSIAPEVFVDTASGENNGVLALAFGFGF